MRNFKAYIYSIFGIFLLIGISNASNLENRVTSYFNGIANSLGTSVSSLLSENTRVKYLDLNIGVQEHLKPTISLTNVNMISEYGNSAIFNQNSLNLHNNDQTINLGNQPIPDFDLAAAVYGRPSLRSVEYVLGLP